MTTEEFKEFKEVTWQYRTKANYDGYRWSRWINCSKEFYEHREKTPLRNCFCYELRKVHDRCNAEKKGKSTRDWR